MNFLAHLYLSFDREEIVIGNFIADHVKGKRIFDYPPGIQLGIQLHRAIDAFTDSHPVVDEAILKLRAGHGKYACVVADMFLDHFLALHWEKWHPEKLEDFTHRMYAILLQNHDILPERTQYMLSYMVKDNWLFNYGTLAGLNKALNGMSRRTPFISNMELAVENLKADYAFFEDVYHRFFPDVIKFSREFLESSE